jgi:glutamyl-tRNA reductase
MSLFVIGLNHRTARLDLRECLAFLPEHLPEALQRLHHHLGLEEIVILSTCNRMEIYVNAEDGPSARVTTLQFLKGHAGPVDIEPHLYLRQDQAAVHHLFRVAAGLDSMVVGEQEILGQVKQAYQAAQKAGLTGKLMNVLFQRSLYIGKRVRTETGLSLGAASIGSAAVSMAERIFGNLQGCRVMVLGAGKMAELTAKHLLSQKVHSLVVANRTYERACELAQQFGGTALHFDEALPRLAEVDIVICSAAVPHPVITVDQVRSILPQRKGRSLFFIDIAVPRDVHPDVHHLDNVYVYNIDDLQRIIADNLARRANEVCAAEQIIAEKSEEFGQWLSAYQAGQGLNLKHFSNPVAEPLLSHAQVLSKG